MTAHPTESAALEPHAMSPDLPVGATLVVALPLHRPERVNHRPNRRPPNPHPRRTALRPRANNRAIAPTLPVGATLVVALPLHRPERVNRTNPPCRGNPCGCPPPSPPHRHNRRPPNPHPRRTARRPRANNRAPTPTLPVGATLVVALPVHHPKRVNHRHNRRPPNPHPRRTALRPRANNRALAPTLPVGATLVVALPLHHPQTRQSPRRGSPTARDRCSCIARHPIAGRANQR